MTYGLLSRSCFYCQNLKTVAPLSLKIKRFVKVIWLWGNNITTYWDGVPNGTLWMRFTYCLNLMFFTSPWLEIYIFKLVILLNLSSSKLIVILLTLGKLKFTLLFSFLTLGRSVILPTLANMVDHKKQSVWYVIQELQTRSGKSRFQWFN